MLKYLPLFICAALQSGVSQAAPRSEDFAFQAELSPATQQLQRVQLPIEVLLALTRADMGDIAVFDGQGSSLPHSIVQPLAEKIEAQVELPFHEFDSFQQRQSTRVTRREQNQQGGHISQIETTEVVPGISLRRDYLIELEQKDRHIQQVELDWSHEPAGQILQLKVEIGNELDRLRVLFAAKSLTNLDRDTEAWRMIGPIPSGQKYLRLTPLASANEFTLNRAIGHYQQILPAPKVSQQLATTRVEEDGQTYYQFEIPSKIAPEALRIIPSQAHSMIRGDLYASSDEFKKQHRSVAHNFKQHNIDDTEVRASYPIRIPGNYTHMRFSSRDALTQTPSVELIYPAYELLFLGNGSSHYTLAWGNYASDAHSNELRQILNNDLEDPAQRGELVRLGPGREAGGIARLSAEPALPWQKWLLWALLGLAVIVTGRMALKLYQEMNRDESANSA